MKTLFIIWDSYFLDYFSKKQSFEINKKKSKGLFQKTVIETKDAIFLKPQTFMNLSGESVGPLLKFFKIPPEFLVVIYDDLDMEFGKIRTRDQGRAAGHNGVQNIIDVLGTDKFHRIKIGIGRPPVETAMDPSDWVLSKMPKQNLKQLPEIFEKVEENLLTLLQS